MDLLYGPPRATRLHPPEDAELLRVCREQRRTPAQMIRFFIEAALRENKRRRAGGKRKTT